MIVDEILERKGRQTYEASPNWTARKVVAMLAAWNVGTVVVTDVRGNLIGIVSERDVIRALNEFGQNVMRFKVGDLMTKSVITCHPDTDIGEALSLMGRHRIRHLPVVGDDRLQGVISIRDVLDVRISMLEESFSMLERRERDASHALVAAEAADRAKTEFLAHMSHELRTPLNAIIGFSDVIAGDHLGSDVKLSRQYAEHINRAGQHLLKLVDAVLDLSKMVSGELDLEETAVEFDILLREALDPVEGYIADKQLTIHTDIAATDVVLTADRARLKQVLLNLLSNAVKFSRAGSVVELRAGIGGDGDLAIAISDHGAGMRPEHIAIALEPFRHIDNDPAHATTGTGIGLSLAKILVEKHGGSLSVTSQPGEGTTVSISLPGWRLRPSGTPPLLEAVA